MAAAPDGGWQVESFGDCTFASAATSTPAPVQVVLPPEAAASAYSARRLSVETAPASWDVVTGAGARLSTPAFASLISDSTTTELLVAEQARAQRSKTILRFTGAAIATSALVPLIGAPTLSTSAGEDRVWSALFLATTGALTWMVAPSAIGAVSAHQHSPADYYTLAQAQEHIDRYNRTLQQELGLAPAADSPALAPQGAEADPQDAEADPQDAESTPAAAHPSGDAESSAPAEAP